MKFLELRLKTRSLSVQRDFYARALRLPVLSERGGNLTIQVGRTHLIFEQVDGWRGAYHIAFDVPENQFMQAKAWITRRTPLICMNGDDQFHFTSWNAHSLYFVDAGGNVLEFIARHNQPTASDAPFTHSSIVGVSEIGLAVDDVRGAVDGLCETLNVDVYDGAGSDTFTAVGDEDGLLIVVKRGRSWYPETGVRADSYPVSVGLADAAVEHYQICDLPYFVRRAYERPSFSKVY